MRIHHCLAIVALVAAVTSCGSAKSPWARKMPKAERIVWPTKCGIPADRVSASDGQGDYAYTSYEGQLNAEPPATLTIACDLSWNRDKDRLAHMRVSIGRFEPALAAADIEPLLVLALSELRPADQVVARRLATGALQSELSGGLEIEGGFSRERRRWQISVLAK